MTARVSIAAAAAEMMKAVLPAKPPATPVDPFVRPAVPSRAALVGDDVEDNDAALGSTPIDGAALPDALPKATEEDADKRVASGVCAALGVVLGDAPWEREAVPVPVDEGVAVDVPVPVIVGDVAADTVVDGVTAAVPELLPVTLALAPRDNVAVGVAVALGVALNVLEPLSLPVRVGDGVTVDVPVPLPVALAVGVADALEVAEIDSEPLLLPVLDGLAPTVTEDVGERETDRERERVEDGVLEEVDVADAVGDPVEVPLFDRVEVVDGVPLLLADVDALAPTVTLAVAVPETDDDNEAVELGDCDGVPLVDVVGVPVDVTDGVCCALGVDVAVPDGVTVAVNETDGVPLAVPPTVNDGDDVAVNELERLCVLDSLSLIVPVPVGVPEAVPVPDPVVDPVGVLDGVLDGDGVAESVIVDVTEGVLDDEGVPLAVDPTLSVVDGVADGVDVRLRVVDALTVAVAV